MRRRLLRTRSKGNCALGQISPGVREETRWVREWHAGDAKGFVTSRQCTRGSSGVRITGSGRQGRLFRKGQDTISEGPARRRKWKFGTPGCNQGPFRRVARPFFIPRAGLASGWAYMSEGARWSRSLSRRIREGERKPSAYCVGVSIEQCDGLHAGGRLLDRTSAVSREAFPIIALAFPQPR